MKAQDGKTKIKDIFQKNLEVDNQSLGRICLGVGVSSDASLFREIKQGQLEFFNFGELNMEVTNLDKILWEFMLEQNVSPQLFIEESHFLENSAKKLILGKYAGKAQPKYAHIPTIKMVQNPNPSTTRNARLLWNFP